MLAERGASIIDADAIARATTAADGSAMDAIRHAFGAEYVDASGALDRNAIRDLVYRDAGARQRLEAIVHPLVEQEMARQADAAAAVGSPLVVFDIPLLVEGIARWRGRLDHIVVVDCEPATQIARVQARSGLGAEQIQAILAAQATREQRLAVADSVIENGASTTLPDLRKRVIELGERLARYH